MDESINIAKELRKELDDLALFKDYYKLKSLIESDEDLNSIKKEIVVAKNNNDEELLKKLIERYNSHLLIVNFKVIEDEVINYLKQISAAINKK